MLGFKPTSVNAIHFQCKVVSPVDTFGIIHMKFRKTSGRNVDFVTQLKNCMQRPPCILFRNMVSRRETKLPGYLPLTHAMKCLPTILSRCLECMAG